MEKQPGNSQNDGVFNKLRRAVGIGAIAVAGAAAQSPAQAQYLDGNNIDEKYSVSNTHNPGIATDWSPMSGTPGTNYNVSVPDHSYTSASNVGNGGWGTAESGVYGTNYYSIPKYPEFIGGSAEDYLRHVVLLELIPKALGSTNQTYPITVQQCTRIEALLSEASARIAEILKRERNGSEGDKEVVPAVSEDGQIR